MRKNFGTKSWFYPLPVLVIGTYDENGNPSPYKLTFVLKCNQDLKVDDAKADYKANQKGKKVS